MNVLTRIIGFLSIFFLINFEFLAAQEPTLKETENYINEKMKVQTWRKGKIVISRNGTTRITILENGKYRDSSVYFFDIKDMKISEVIKAKENEADKYKIIVECLSENCIFSEEFWRGKRERQWHGSNYLYYFKDEVEANKLRKALLRARAICLKYKDPFD
ncbi:MAG: hypothetical protein WD077_10350 [Bacteroidia bacterium]